MSMSQRESTQGLQTAAHPGYSSSARPAPAAGDFSVARDPQVQTARRTRPSPSGLPEQNPHRRPGARGSPSCSTGQGADTSPAQPCPASLSLGFFNSLLRQSSVSSSEVLPQKYPTIQLICHPPRSSCSMTSAPLFHWASGVSFPDFLTFHSNCSACTHSSLCGLLTDCLKYNST